MACFEDFFPSYKELLDLDRSDAPAALVEWLDQRGADLFPLLDEIRFTDGLRSELERWLTFCDTEGADPFDPTAPDLFNYLAPLGPLAEDGSGSRRKLRRAYRALEEHLPADAAARLGHHHIQYLLMSGTDRPRPEPQRATPLLFDHLEKMLAPPPPDRDELSIRAALLISHQGRVRLASLDDANWDDPQVAPDVVDIQVGGRILHLPRHPDPRLDIGTVLETLRQTSDGTGRLLVGDHFWWEARLRRSAGRLGIAEWTAVGYAGNGSDLETIWRVSAGISEAATAHLRNRAAILGGQHLALRPNEVLSLHSSHLSLHPEGLVVEIPVSKANPTGRRTAEKIAAVYHHDPELCGVRAILELCHLRGYQVAGSQLDGRDEGPLFGTSGNQTARGLKMNVDTMRKTLQALADEAGLREHFVCYSLRRGAAHQMRDNGESDPRVQKKLRHARAETTAAYLKRDAHEARQGILNEMMERTTRLA